ncbi:MAG: D-glycero-D-manno-heptose 1,7-bisphosphate phosphatase [Kiritimatiellia bacterium]|jgi:D-glycero-D-manno-heptose 1,7-bisphosphate phosphatase
MTAPINQAQRCVFFDRDGIVNEAPSDEEYYVLTPDRLLIIPEFFECLKIVAKCGYVSVIVTNQKCVHLEKLSMDGLETVHAKLRTAIDAAGAELLAIYSAVHGDGHPDSKPAPGMFLSAAQDHNIALEQSWMIGDSPRDMDASHAAGCTRNILVSSTKQSPRANDQLASMKELPDFLQANLPKHGTTAV